MLQEGEGGAVKINLTRGYKAKIDKKDYRIIAPYSWCAHLRPPYPPYAVTNMKINGKVKTIGMHRLIMGTTTIKHLEIDHINGDSLTRDA